MTRYDFDQIIDRRKTNAMNTDGFRDYIFNDSSLALPFEDEEFIRMWVADMDFPVAKEITEALTDRIQHPIFGYTQVYDPSYVRAVQGWTSRHNQWTFNADHLVTSHGVIPALFELAQYIGEPGDQAFMLTPSYAYFQKAAERNHLETVYSDLLIEDGEYVINFQEVEDLFSTGRIKLFFLCNPHNPTGRIWRRDELERLADLARAHDIWLISDEIHCDIRRTGVEFTSMHEVASDYDKLVVAFAQSKAFNLAGFKFSNLIIIDDQLRTYWKENHYPFENPLSIVANQAAYEHGDEWLAQMKAYVDDNFEWVQDFIQEHLPEAGFIFPQATYLAWVDVKAYLPKGVDNLPLYFAENAGVLLEGGDMFVHNSDHHIRLNLAMPKSQVKKGLQRIAQLLNP